MAGARPAGPLKIDETAVVRRRAMTILSENVARLDRRERWCAAFEVIWNGGDIVNVERALRSMARFL